MLDLVASGVGSHDPLTPCFCCLDWLRLGWRSRVSFGCLCLLLVRMLGPIQHFRSAILQVWHLKVTAGLAEREGFRERFSLRRWPRCLIMAWLVAWAWSSVDCWAASLGQLAERRLESALGAYPADHAGCWVVPDFWDAEDIALDMVDHPNIWTDWWL